MSLRCLPARLPSGASQTSVFQRVPGRAESRSFTPIATQAPARRAAAPSRSVSGPGTSTAAAHMRRWTSAPSRPNVAQRCAQRELG